MFATRWTHLENDAADYGVDMRLITWNVNSLKARLPRVLELLAAHRPDVLCLQETKSTGEAFPHEALAAAGYRALDHSTGRWNGVALVVPVDVEVAGVERGLPGEPDPSEGRWIEASVPWPAPGGATGGATGADPGAEQRAAPATVRVVSTYVPNGREPGHAMFTAKLAFLDRMAARAQSLAASGPTVIAGDVNVAPEDRDVWDPAAFVGATHVTSEERAGLDAVVAAGYVDAFRAVAPDEVGFTWWDYRMGAFRRGMGMRIDLALVSSGLTVTGCEVDTTYRRANAAGDKPSDHAPLVVALRG